MEKRVSISEFIKVIKRLPEDSPVHDPHVWYKTQREHWLGWLEEYNTGGAYGRIPGKNRDARYAYNHVVNPGMLLYLIRAISIRSKLVKAAERSLKKGSTMMEHSGAIRKIVPWAEIYQAIWGGASRGIGPGDSED